MKSKIFMFLCFYVFSAHAADLPMVPPAYDPAKARQAAIALKQKEARDKAQAIAADKKSSSQQKAQALSNLQNSLSQAGVNTRELTLEISRLRRRQELIAGAERAKAKALSTGVPRMQVSGSSGASTLSTEKMNQRDQEIASLNKKLADKKMTPKQREYEIGMTTKKLNESGLLNAETSAYMGALSTANNQQPRFATTSPTSRNGDGGKKKTEKPPKSGKPAIVVKPPKPGENGKPLQEAQNPELQTICDKCNFTPKEVAGFTCLIKKNGNQLIMSSGEKSHTVNLTPKNDNQNLWSDHTLISNNNVDGGYYKSSGYEKAEMAIYSGGVWSEWSLQTSTKNGVKECNVNVRGDLDPVLEASKQTKDDANTFLNPSKWSDLNCKDNVAKFNTCGAGSFSKVSDLSVDRLMTDGKGNYYVLAENSKDSNGNSEIRVYKATKSGMKLEKMAAGTEVAENGDLKYGRKGLFGKVGDFFGGKHGMTSISIDDSSVPPWVVNSATHQCSYKSAIEKLADKQNLKCDAWVDYKKQQMQDTMNSFPGGAL